MLRLIRRVIWDLAPNSRERDLRTESRFWHRWLASEGLEWPEDYQRRFDPDAPVQDHLAPFIGRLAGHEIDILDVGSGPLTKVGRVHGSKRLSITAVDVLADTTTRS